MKKAITLTSVKTMMGIAFSVKEGKAVRTFIVRKGSRDYKICEDLVADYNKAQEKRDSRRTRSLRMTLLEMIDYKAFLKIKTKQQFFISDDGLCYAKGIASPVHPMIAAKLKVFVKKNLPLEPLLNFWKNLLKNPDVYVRDLLYDFVVENNLPLTDDGCFLGYKKVTTVDGDLMDSHSRTIRNNVGDIVRMPRKSVNADHKQDCSYGLHVGSWAYSSSFSGDVLLIVKVNPADVVSVPLGYGHQKLRCCGYTVIKRLEKVQELKGEIVFLNKNNIPVSTISGGKHLRLQNFEKGESYDLKKLTNSTLLRIIANLGGKVVRKANKLLLIREIEALVKEKGITYDKRKKIITF